MLWLLPPLVKTIFYLFGCPVGGVFAIFSSILYSLCLFFVIPCYFLYAGPTAAIKFSLLLCAHSLLLGMVPRIVVCNLYSIKCFSRHIFLIFFMYILEIGRTNGGIGSFYCLVISTNQYHSAISSMDVRKAIVCIFSVSVCI